MAPIRELFVHDGGRGRNVLVFFVQSRGVTLLLVDRTTDSEAILTRLHTFRLDPTIINFVLPECKSFKVSQELLLGQRTDCSQSFSTIRTEGFSDEMVQAGEPAQHSSTELR